MTPVSVLPTPSDDLHHLTDRLAARALRLALDPYLYRCHGVAELAWLAGDSPSYLGQARRRLRCGDSGRTSRIVARAEQLLTDAQNPTAVHPAGVLHRDRSAAGPREAVVTSFGGGSQKRRRTRLRKRTTPERPSGDKRRQLTSAPGSLTLVLAQEQ
jgi:hypothetical protein